MKLVEENELENEAIMIRRRSSSGVPTLIEVDFTDIERERAAKETKKLIPNELKELSIDFEGEVEGQEWQPSELLQGVPFISEGDITLQRKLGSGAFGVVYQAKYKNSVVAFKELNIAHAKRNMPFLLKRDPEEVETLLKEAFEWETLGLYGLKHPHIVEFITLCKTKDHKNNPRCGMMMKFCDGGNLEDIVEKLRVEEKRLSTTCILRLALEIAAGLRYLHGEGLVHHDLKTANILIHHFKALLADLGLAQKDALVQPGAEAKVVQQGIRDCLWISPEEFRDGPSASTPASDIYAFGLILFHLLSARKPYEDFSDLEFRTLVGTQGFRETIPAYCPDPLKKLITLCWHQDPLQRPSIEAVITQLKEAVQTLVPDAIAMLLDIELDIFLHQHRPKLAEYRAPFATPVSIDGDIDDYWQRLEAEEKREEKEIKEGHSRASHLLRPESVKTSLEQSLMTTNRQVSVLFGEGGLGKTLTVYRLADQSLSQHHSMNLLSSDEKKWRFIFLRTAIQPWSHHHLDDAIDKTICYLGLEKSVAQLKELPIVFVVDDYSNLQRDAVPKNLSTQIGLQNWPHAKLFVTTRREGLTGPEEFSRFEMDGHLDTFYLLPSSTVQLMTSLRDSLSWNAVTEATFTATLEETSSSRAILRNPFLRSLFIQSYALISKKKDLKTLTRADIYDCATEHWLESVWNLLDNDTQTKLLGSFKTPIESFNAFAEERVAFPCYQDPKLIPSREVLESLEFKDEATLSSNNWFHLTELLVAKAKIQFAARKDKDRAIFTEKDYVYSRGEQRAKQFMALSLLTEQEDRYGFIHKSCEEHFVTRHIIKTIDVKNLNALIKALNTRNIQEEVGVIELIIEKLWSMAVTNETRKQQLLNLVLASKHHPVIGKAASNAMTLLVRLYYSFSEMNLDDIHIPDADCRRGIFHRTKMRRAELDGVNFTAAYLQTANLSDSSMKNVKMGERAPLKGHAQSIKCMAYDDTHHLIATGSGGINKDCGIRIWEAETELLIQSLPGHTDMVVGLAFLPNTPSSTLISMSRDKTLSIWNVKTGERKVYSLSVIPHGSMTLSPDGEIVAFASRQIKEGNEIKISFIPSNLPKPGLLKRLGNLFHNKTHVTQRSSKKVEEYKKENHKIDAEEKATIDPRPSPPILMSLFFLSTGKIEQNFESHSGKIITALSFVPATKVLHLASSGEDNRLALWDLSPSNPSMPPLLLWEQQSPASSKIAFTPNAEKLITLTSQGATLWQTQTGYLTQTLHDKNLQIRTTSITASNQYIVVGDDRNIQVFDKAGQSKKLLSGHTDSVIELIFTKTEIPFLLSASQDKTVRLWETDGFDQVENHFYHTLSITSISLTPDEQTIVTASLDRTVKYWDATTGRLQKTLTFETRITMISISANGDFLAVGDVKGRIYVWDRKHDKCHTIFEAHKGSVTALDIYIDSTKKHLISGGKDSALRLWDIGNNTLIRTFEDKRILTHITQCTFFSKDGTYLYTTGNVGGSVKRWDCTSGKVSYTIGGENEYPRVALSFDGKELACANEENSTIEIWQLDLDPVQCVQVFIDHRDVTWLQYDKSGKYLVSGSSDGVVHLWQRGVSESLISLMMDSPINQIALSMDARTFYVSQSYDLTLYGFQIDREKKGKLAALKLYNGGKLNVRGLSLQNIPTLSPHLKKLFATSFAEVEYTDAVQNETYNLNIKNTTPLTRSLFGDEKEFRRLLANKVDVNQALEYGWSPLYLAAFCGLVNYCETLYKAGANVHQEDNDGATALYVACENGRTKVVEFLLTHGAIINQGNGKGITPLCIATEKNHREIVELLVENKADINQGNKYGAIPLFAATDKGNLDITTFLLEHKADVNYKTNNMVWGITPVFIPVQNNRLNIVTVLLKHKADINLTAIGGETPLYTAVKNNHTDMVTLLLKHKADINTATLHTPAEKNNCSLITLLVKHKADINRTDTMVLDGCTALYLAAQERQRDAVSLLLKYKAKVNQPRKDGEIPLCAAIQRNHYDIALQLLEHKADINHRCGNGNPLLFTATQKALPTMIELLLRFNADINQSGENGNTSLSIATQQGLRDIVELLLKYKADIHKTNNDGITSFPMAATEGYPEILLLLMASKADVNEVFSDGMTSLMVTAFLGDSIEVVKLLLANKANISAKDSMDNTALHWLSNNEKSNQTRDIAIANLLYERGMNINDQNIEGDTASHLSAKSGNRSLLQYFVDKGADMTLHNEEGQTPLDIINSIPVEVKSIAQEVPVLSTTRKVQSESLSQQDTSSSSSQTYRSTRSATLFGLSSREKIMRKPYDIASDDKSLITASNHHGNIFNPSNSALSGSIGSSAVMAPGESISHVASMPEDNALREYSYSFSFSTSDGQD